MYMQKTSLYVLKAWMILCLMLFWKPVQGQLTLTEEDWVIPTYPVGEPDKNPMFFKNESYQGASRHYYPYYLQDVFSNQKEDQAWKALILENEYIKLCVTPEIGGKIYYATDKTNGYHFLYKNDVVKPANIGMTGAWVSGGIEWNVLHHHRASSFMPVDYEWVENEDGSKTIWIGETEMRHRMRWTIGITAFPDKSYFQTDIKIHNPTPFTQTFLYWANVATHTNKDYQAIFPPSVQVATYHAKNAFTHWPVSTEMFRGQDFTQGVDISWWKNAKRANSFFAHDLKEDFMGGYDHGKQSGTVHIGDHNIVKGAKLWEWGSGPLGQAIEGQLNENAGPYVELMVGAYSDNQPDYSWIRPYEVKTVRQYWYPVRDIGGFKNANLNGAVNLEKRGENSVFLGYYSTQKINTAKVILKNRDKVIFEKRVEVSPSNTFTETIKLDESFQLTDLHTELLNLETGESLISYQPKIHPKPQKLPETVTPPTPPAEIATIEELYLTASRIEQFYNPRLDPMDYYLEALDRDPQDARTNTAVGNIYLKKGDYEKARKYLSRAIRRLTQNYTRPADCEALYLQGINLKAMELYEEAIDTLYRASWDYAFHAASFLELARISAMQGDYAKALNQINESLATNARNNSAIALKVSLLRKLGKHQKALSILRPVLDGDPLDFRAANESILTAKSMGRTSEANRLQIWLDEKMRDYDQNYLNLATAYLNDGLLDEAKTVLMRFNGENPIVSYYLGYLADKMSNQTEAKKHFQKASAQSVDYCFPFRLETVKVLKTALKYQPSDGKAFYYLGNILFNHQPSAAIQYWEKAVKLKPNLAIAYRNLGWGYYQHNGKGDKAISAYENALELKKDDPMYYVELDQLYEMSNTAVERRLQLFEGNEESVSQREDAFARQIEVLTLAGKADKAVKLLSGKAFTFNETSQRVYDVIADAHLSLGIKYLKEKKYTEALKAFQDAEVPEELAFFSASGKRNIQSNYLIGLSWEGLKKKSKAKALYQLNAEASLESSPYIRFYQGLSFAKLGNKEKSDEIFQKLIDEAQIEIEKKASEEVDFFAKFGEKESENARLSRAYMLKGLGHKGLGEMDLASNNLKKAIELSASNLYAIIEFDLL